MTGSFLMPEKAARGRFRVIGKALSGRLNRRVPLSDHRFRGISWGGVRGDEEVLDGEGQICGAGVLAGGGRDARLALEFGRP